jgi:hypothetical protein
MRCAPQGRRVAEESAVSPAHRFSALMRYSGFDVMDGVKVDAMMRTL